MLVPAAMVPPERMTTMNAADIGDWVVGGFGEDADYGYVYGRDDEG